MVNKLIHPNWSAVIAIILISGLMQPVGAAADEKAKPVAVLSIASVDQLMEDIDYLTQVAGRADVGMFLQSMSSSIIECFDRTRPAGVLITIENDEPKGIAFLPVRDGDKLLRRLKERMSAEVDDLGNGIKKLESGKGAYFKQQQEWLYFSDHPRHLSHLPDDPESMLGGLNQQYSVALRILVGNIPPGMKDFADYLIQTGIDTEFNKAELKDQGELDAAFVESVRSNMKRWSSALIQGADQITVGWMVDVARRRTYIDVHAQAKDGSPLSRQLHSLTNSHSTFNGFFVDKAAAAFQGSLRLSEEGQEQIGSLIDYVRAKAIEGIEADRNLPESFKDIVTNVLDVVDRTVREGKTDAGATMLLAPNSFGFVGGMRVANGHALADAFQQLFELAKHEPNMPEVRFYARKHGDLDLHTLVLPVDESDVDARKLLGENVDIAIATGSEQLYFALGKGSDRLLESIVDRSREIGPQKVPLLDLRVAVKPMMSFLASIDQENEKQQLLAEAIERAEGGDGIQLKVEQIDNGIGARLEIEEGVLVLIGNASREADGN